MASADLAYDLVQQILEQMPESARQEESVIRIVRSVAEEMVRWQELFDNLDEDEDLLDALVRWYEDDDA